MSGHVVRRFRVSGLVCHLCRGKLQIGQVVRAKVVPPIKMAPGSQVRTYPFHESCLAPAGAIRT